MFLAKSKMILTLTVITLLHVACAPNKKEEKNNTEDPAIGAMSSQLQSVGDEFLPASVNENGVATMSVQNASNKLSRLDSNTKDICAGVEFIECQPRLIRAYLQIGREGVYSTQRLVSGIARSLSGVQDGTSGEFRDDAKNVRITYSKRSAVDFDVLMFEGNVPAGRISAKSGVYNIQFDMGIVDKDKPGNLGGKMDIQVNYVDRTNWDSQITITGIGCNPAKPEDPETARLHVTRKGDVWHAQSMFYNGLAGYYAGAKSCSVKGNDTTGLVIYTDLVADSTAAKAALYLLRRNEQSVAQLQNYGINSYCQNYPDLCQSLATAIGQSASNVSTHFTGLKNNYCVHRGNSQVFWNNDCNNVSATIASTPLSQNSQFLSPFDFYRLNVVIPNSL